MSNPKRIEDRQRRNLPAVIEVDAAGQLVDADDPPAYPAPPAGLSAMYARAWDGLWTSPVGQLLDPVSDLPAVMRLFSLYQLGQQLDDVVSASMHNYLDALTRPAGVSASGRLSEGDDQVPELDDKIMAYRLRVASETRLLEGQLGLSPRSRLALGLALAAGKKAGLGGGLDDAVNDADG